MSKKLVIVGDGSCGKTCLLMRFSEPDKEISDEYIPTVFDNYKKDTTIDGKSVCIELWDTAGQEDYDRLRPLSYDPLPDVIIIAYCIDSKDSLQNVVEKWHPEIIHFCKNVPIVLVGNKSDLRTVEKDREGKMLDKSTFNTTDEILKISTQIGAYGSLECSAMLNLDVDKVFDVAVKAAMKVKNRNQASEHGDGDDGIGCVKKCEIL